MAANRGPKYITVTDISLDNITTAASGTAIASRKVDKQSGNCWAQTVLWMNEKKALVELVQLGDVKETAKQLREIFTDNFLTEYDELPEKGRNARTGKTVEIIDSKGVVKWGSWEETKIPYGYMSDIAQVVEAGLISELIPEAKKVMARNDILKNCKGAESPMKTCQRSLEMIEKKSTDLSQADLQAFIIEMQASLTGMKELDAQITSALAKG